jgi:DNA-directed RNA polymerase subunit M/transcription elongation factor TFIIS
MPKCPKCGKEINSITNVQSGYMAYALKVNDENGDYDYDSEEPDFTTDDSLNDFRCPECNESLFPDSEGDAVAFLRGEIEARYDEEKDCVVIEKRNEIKNGMKQQHDKRSF